MAFESAWPNRTASVFGGLPIWLIGRDLVANKRAAGRPQDLLDLELLARHEP